MKSLKELSKEYLFNIDIDYECYRRIKIAEFKLGIYDPESNIVDVDFMDNPIYSGLYDIVHKGELIGHVFRRTGKTNMSKIMLRRAIKQLTNNGVIE